METGNPTPPPATASEIRDIVGEVDDEVVESILAIAPSAAEVLAACAWLRTGPDDMRQGRLAPGGKTARILEILESEEPDPDNGAS